MTIWYSEHRDIPVEKILALYEAHNWSSAKKSEQLHQALKNSHSLVSAWDDEELVGIGNAISDGFLVVYYPHLLVSPKYQGRGIGRKIIGILQEKYRDLHMQILTSDAEAVGFYEKCGFTKAGKTASMWIYRGDEH